MALSDMQVFNEYIMPAAYDALGQMIEQFNAASAGAIVLSTDGFDGSYNQMSFYTTLKAARRRVNRLQANGAQAATDLAQAKHSAVKVAGGFGPIAYEPGQMTWLRKPTAEGVSIAATAFAELLLQDQLNTAIASAIAAVENNAAVTNDVSASAGITYSAINNAHAKFGDSSQRIVADCMDGATYHKLIGQNITNAGRLFEQANVTVVDMLGKRAVVTDAPAFREAGTPDKEKVLSLVAGGVTINNVNDVVQNVETSNGKERIETTMQVDYTFGVSMMGYSWDEANGGASPTDAALATGSNWDKVVDDDKATAGVITVGDAAQ